MLSVLRPRAVLVACVVLVALGSAASAEGSDPVAAGVIRLTSEGSHVGTFRVLQPDRLVDVTIESAAARLALLISTENGGSVWALRAATAPIDINFFDLPGFTWALPPQTTYFAYVVTDPPMPATVTLTLQNATGTADIALGTSIRAAIRDLPETGLANGLQRWSLEQPFAGAAHTWLYTVEHHQERVAKNAEWRLENEEGVASCFPGTTLATPGSILLAASFASAPASAPLNATYVRTSTPGVETEALGIWIETMPGDWVGGAELAAPLAWSERQAHPESDVAAACAGSVSQGAVERQVRGLVEDLPTGALSLPVPTAG